MESRPPCLLLTWGGCGSAEVLPVHLCVSSVGHAVSIGRPHGEPEDHHAGCTFHRGTLPVPMCVWKHQVMVEFL